MKRFCMVTILVIAAGASSQDSAKDKKPLDGAWTPMSAELAGQKFPEATLKTISLVIKDAEYTVRVGEVVDKGTIKIDAAAKPRAMDITGTDGPNKGKTLLAIYELDGDTLRICYDLAGKNRPTEFTSSKEKPFFLAVYKRANNPRAEPRKRPG